MGVWKDWNDEIIKREHPSWGLKLQYTVWKNDGLACFPGVNLVKNLGFGEGATNTTEGSGIFDDIDVSTIKKDLILLNGFKSNKKFDKTISKNHYYIRWYVILLKIFFKKIRLYKYFVKIASYTLKQWRILKK